MALVTMSFASGGKLSYSGSVGTVTQASMPKGKSISLGTHN
jgi:hypothetical protein